MLHSPRWPWQNAPSARPRGAPGVRALLAALLPALAAAACQPAPPGRPEMAVLVDGSASRSPGAAGDPSCATEAPIPGFSIGLPERKWLEFRPDRVPFSADGPGVRVLLTRDGDVYELEVRNRTAPIEKVRFAWWDPPRDVGPRDQFLIPRALGVAQPVAARLPSMPCVYPGKCLSPLVIHHTPDRASLLAAALWPPRRTIIEAGRKGHGLQDPEPIGRGETRRYRALAVARCGSDAWRDTVGVFREWLEPQMRGAGLLPIRLSDGLKQAEGWWTIGLQNSPRFDPRKLLLRWELDAKKLGWVQIWGQMSNFAGKPELARFPLAPGEETGCCLTRIPLHPRYGTGLRSFIREIAREGRVGLYTSTGPGVFFEPDGSESPSLLRLRAWLDANRALGANAVYIDVFGNHYLGDPLRVARLLLEPAFRDAVIEYPVDIYPAAYLCSGSLSLSRYRSDHDRTEQQPRVFTRLGRSILPDRILFLGENNGGHLQFGETTRYSAQREAFLLGAKLDVIHLRPGRAVPGRPDRIVDEILEERKRSGWWSLEPVYRDEEGLELPRGIQARRFRGRGGEDLLVAINWDGLRGQRVWVDGRQLELPRRRFSIQQVPQRPSAQ